MTWTEEKLRALSIIAGAILACLCISTGLDGFGKVTAGALVGFGVGKGMTRASVARVVRKLKVY